MIIVLGILVDDAVVVGESVFESRGNILDPVEGTIQGVNRVSTATVFGCFTTVAAFYPLLLIRNDLGKVFAGFSVVVIVSLLVSLVESKLILPAHLAAIPVRSKPAGKSPAVLWGVMQTGASRALNIVRRKLYKPLLTQALRHRYASLMVFITAGICGFSMLFSGYVRTVFFPEVPGQFINVQMHMKSGSPQGLTVENIWAIERAAETINARAMETGDGVPPIVRVMAAMHDPQSAEIWAEMQPEARRVQGSMETLRQWRELVGVLEGTEELAFNGSFETGGGFVVELAARHESVLEDAAQRLTQGAWRPGRGS